MFLSMKIVIDDRIPFIRGVFEPWADVLYKEGAKISAPDLQDADALVVRTRTRCDASLLDGTSVRVIATATIGSDHIDTDYCDRRGIVWRNAPGCNSWSVQQYISSVLVRLCRKYGMKFPDVTLGVVGVGNVGSKVVRAARALGMEVLMCDPPRERREGPEDFVDLDTLVQRSDIVTLHVPLQKDGPDATRHLFDSERLSMMRPSQILINTSRGPVVDNAALKDALGRGALKGAVLDVWEGEPDIDPALVDLLDIATPHIAGYSADGKANGTASAVRTVAAVLGLPLETWSVPEIPAPRRNLEFQLDAAGRSSDEVLSDAVLYAYDVLSDSDDLRLDISGFEELRGFYPVRREPSAYSVYVSHCPPSLRESLETLGFNVK